MHAVTHFIELFKWRWNRQEGKKLDTEAKAEAHTQNTLDSHIHCCVIINQASNMNTQNKCNDLWLQLFHDLSVFSLFTFCSPKTPSALKMFTFSLVAWTFRVFVCSLKCFPVWLLCCGFTLFHCTQTIANMSSRFWYEDKTISVD